MKFLPGSVAALAAAALFPVLMAAQQPQPPAPQGPPPQGRGQGRGMMGQGPQGRQQVNRPQLTEQQREQLRAFEEQHRAALETSRRELGDLHRQLDEQLTAAQIDSAKVNALRSAIVQKETALAQHRVDRLATLSSMLTAEQRQALRGRGIGQMFGPGGGRGGAMAGPRGPMGGRGMQQRRAPGQPGQRGLRVRPGAQGRGVLRDRLDDARLRAQVRRLEMQIEALRRRIR